MEQLVAKTRHLSQYEKLALKLAVDPELAARTRECTRLRNLAYRARVRADPKAHRAMLEKHYARQAAARAKKMAVECMIDYQKGVTGHPLGSMPDRTKSGIARRREGR